MPESYLILFEEGGVIQDYTHTYDKDFAEAEEEAHEASEEHEAYIFRIISESPVEVRW